MKIIFERSGGFMGRTVSLSVNLDELPADQSGTLKRLVDESDFFNLDDSPLKNHAPDQFLYTITVDTGKIQHTIHASDSVAPVAVVTPGTSSKPIVAAVALLLAAAAGFAWRNAHSRS